MAKAYYSTVFPQPAEAVWEIIRDFNNYLVWVGGAGESRIEEGKSGDAVGAVRNAQYRGRTIRQRLLGCPTSNALRPMGFAVRPHCRSRASRPPCASRRSSMAIVPLSSGGRVSTANPANVTN